MTVDPKYAGLPWIATDETDVYETFDLPEVDQGLSKVTEDSSIDTIKVSLEEAKNVFKQKYVNANDVDFSDRIRPYVNTGYSVERNEYTMYPESEQGSESILDKFQRLQHEVRDFVNEVEQMKQTSTDDVASHFKNNELIRINKELEKLTNNIICYKTHCSLGAEDAINVEIDEDLCGFETHEMFENVQKYVSKHKKDDSSQDKMSWEKYYKSPLSKELNSSKIASIDQRIQRIEAAIGYGERCSSLSSLNSETATKSLVEAVKILTSRCQPLKGGPNVDKIELRLVNLQTKLQNITEKRDLITEADRQNKIAELFVLFQKWQQFQLVLPVIVKRLNDLQQLHNQAMLFTESIGYIDKNQKDMRKEIKHHNEALTQAQKTLHDNVRKLKSNIDALQSKVDHL